MSSSEIKINQNNHILYQMLKQEKYTFHKIEVIIYVRGTPWDERRLAAECG
jgi:hypothetical protein